MKKLVIGILAHVDAGKTTLSESILYLSGRTRKLGRVDNKDAYLDNFELERSRGITIFSKQAVFDLDDINVTLLDTPGHIDFSSEMERTLNVLDYAILVISGIDGVQGHTKTLWRLLNIYEIPTFIFVNKMDDFRADRSAIINELKEKLSDGCIDIDNVSSEEFNEQLALLDERLLDYYLKTGSFKIEHIKEAVKERKVFPCYFGSALKLEGVKEFMNAISKYVIVPSYSDEFRCRIFKVERDDKGNRLTHMKITGGSLKVKDALSNGDWEEKVNQIRIYSGEKYETVNEAICGTVCAVTGLSKTRPGDVLGHEERLNSPVLEPVLEYKMVLPEGFDPKMVFPKLIELEEEDPMLNILWDEQLSEIKVSVMGEVQIEILQSLIKSRFGIEVSFSSGSVIYKETINNVVEGVGHFEPLRHYAEVHLLMEPAERGSGLKFSVECSDDVLGRNWKNLILTHLKEKKHKGVLTGSEITDMKITLVSGRAHNKHTEGGDFREATYRAVRQGLMEAESILLEPYYSFYLELPENMVGRAMNDIDQMHGTSQVDKIENGIAHLTGKCPVVRMRNYYKEVLSYTKGEGHLFCQFAGYDICHNSEEVIKEIGYEPEHDAENPTGSIFCANGAGFSVSWDEVKKYMHVESYLDSKFRSTNEVVVNKSVYKEEWLAPEEVDKILNRAFFSNKKSDSYESRKNEKREPKLYIFGDNKEKTTKTNKEIKETYLLVDGYNVIFAWDELKELANGNMDSARSKLIDYLIKYQSIRRIKIMVVFDAYRVEGGEEHISINDNILVVYTKEAQTADNYIEKFAHDNKKKYNVIVATSDGLQQIIIRGEGCRIMSARELKIEVNNAIDSFREYYLKRQKTEHNYLEDLLSEESKRLIEDFINKNEN